METDDTVVISDEVVEATIDSFTKIDDTGDKRTMNKMARRLGKEQPALLRHAASLQAEHGETVGEAAVFYATLVWAMFDRRFGKGLPTLTQENLDAAEEAVSAALDAVEGLDDKPVPERYAEELAARQPPLYAKLRELLDEDIREEAMTAETGAIILRPTQIVIEAFDAAVSGRRPGERRGPIVRETPKVGRNEPCPCGSGKKYKKCHGAAG